MVIKASTDRVLALQIATESLLIVRRAALDLVVLAEALQRSILVLYDACLCLYTVAYNAWSSRTKGNKSHRWAFWFVERCTPV